ncbi:MAG: hypothetical protein CMD22_04735 [Flavobacteriales bacterium]|nr:hypothetical protein [Flavobacteriales bacterium]|tara:strand:- start:206 stop:1429 length:1224 start_codon:yes stop_codon:yes gene_type:complete
MNVEYFISKRIVSAKENKNVFSRPIIRVTISAIALSVAVMLISLSVLEGFQSEVTNKVVSFGSHIQIAPYQSVDDKTKSPLELTDKFIKSVSTNKEVSEIHPIVYDFALVKTNTDFLGINLKGVAKTYNWENIEDKITQGVGVNSDSSILISEQIAGKLNLQLGDKIRVYFPSVKNERVNVRPFYVCGLYNSSMSEFDESMTFVSINKLQKVKSWSEKEVSLIEIHLFDFSDVERVTKYLSVSVEDYYNKNVKSIHQLYPQIFDWLKLQDVNVMVIILLMLLVAGVNIISSLLILILEKTSFIGILKSMGVSNWSVRKIFLYNAMYLVSKGLLWGNFIAFMLLFVQYQFEIISLDESTYYMSTIPISFNLTSIFLLNIGTLITCLLMMILPTIVITKISVVKAIRFH